MELKDIIHGKQDFAAKKVGDELVLVPVKGSVVSMNAMFTLNEVGSFVWSELEGDVSYDELLRSVVDEFEIDAEVAENDLRKFLQQLTDMMNE